MDVKPVLQRTRWKAVLEIFTVSGILGLTSFGGPIAHLGYFHKEYVSKRKWVGEQQYAELVALCQFLPGPASSQVSMGIGLMRAGWLGALAAWIGFTLPSVLVLVLFAYAMQGFNADAAGWVRGLKIVAVAVVAQAVIGMGQKLAADRARATIAILSASAALMAGNAATQIAIIVSAGLVGTILFQRQESPPAAKWSIPVGKRAAALCLFLFFALLFVLPLLRQLWFNRWLELFDRFYRTGSLVFGGGHVVLPLLENEVVASGWMDHDQFLAGYGAAQAVPGPMFTFASYLGAVIGGGTGAVLTTAAIFLPAFLLIAGSLPFWKELSANSRVQGALAGINAAVVGILLAALYDPLWTTAITSAGNFVLLAILFGLLVFWKTPPWLVVVSGIFLGEMFERF